MDLKRFKNTAKNGFWFLVSSKHMKIKAFFTQSWPPGSGTTAVSGKRSGRAIAHGCVRRRAPGYGNTLSQNNC